MSLTLITPPASEPLNVAEAKDHLRLVDFDDDNSIIAGLITSAREYCEAFQNRAYITQTWELWLDGFPATRHINIPLPPLQSVTHIKYYGTDNKEYILPDTNYFVDDKGFVGRVSLAYGGSWPSVALRPANSIVMQFIAGYGSATNVPQKVKQAMVLEIKLNYDDYTPQEREKLERARDALLWMERVGAI